ncbi:MAG: 50S ribosomal protein L22 [Candidatus Roizmanbacteria bacterium]|nr:MAG: 50S ribosomal protein L22 [Candidatus Roizmanbacteria bacterium]
MESVTYLKNQKISPKKLRFILPQIRKVSPAQALGVLAFMHQKPARVLYKAIKSAVSNAKQTLKVTENLLQFKVLSIDQGHVLRRYNPGSRGSAMPYKKRFAHIKIVLQAKTVIPVVKAPLRPRPSVETTNGQALQVKEKAVKVKRQAKVRITKKTVNK